MSDISNNIETHSYHKKSPSYNDIHAGYSLIGGEHKEVEENSQEWVVDGLDKYSEYEFVVQAYNVIGAGPLSDPITAITLEDGGCFILWETPG